MSELFTTVRPSDWWVLGFRADPAPGDPNAILQAAHGYLQLADDADLACRQVGDLAGDPVALEWIGASGNAFREQIGDLPRDLRKLAISYQMAGDALVGYVPKLSDAQAQADRALASGRVARQWLDDTQRLEASARQSLDAAKSQMYSLWHSSIPSIDEARLAAAQRNIEVAESRLAHATREKRKAQADLDAARQVALQAAAVRDAAATRCANEIAAASDAGIKNKPWWSWQKVSLTIGTAWSVTVQVCKVVVVVGTIAAIVLQAPTLVLGIALAAGVVVLLDALARFTQGKATLQDVIFAIVDAFPFARSLRMAKIGARSTLAPKLVDPNKVQHEMDKENHRAALAGPDGKPRHCLSRMGGTTTRYQRSWPLTAPLAELSADDAELSSPALVP